MNLETPTSFEQNKDTLTESEWNMLLSPKRPDNVSWKPWVPNALKVLEALRESGGVSNTIDRLTLDLPPARWEGVVGAINRKLKTHSLPYKIQWTSIRGVRTWFITKT